MDEAKLIKRHLDNGWSLYENTEKMITFVAYVDDDHEYFKDFYKDSWRFIQYNGRQKVNLICRSN